MTNNYLQCKCSNYQVQNKYFQTSELLRKINSKGNGDISIKYIFSNIFNLLYNHITIHKLYHIPIFMKNVNKITRF